MNWRSLAIALMALGLIGAGMWMVYPPLAMITVGGLLWFDLSRASGGKRKG